MVAAIALQGCERTDVTDVLGLAKADRQLGDPVDVETLRKNAEAAAEEYLATQVEILKDFSKSPYSLTTDYAQVPVIRKLGYKSSFYYFCWDLFLPYRLKTGSGDSYLLIVQVTDRIPGNKHDVSKFRVLHATIIDDRGRMRKALANTPD